MKPSYFIGLLCTVFVVLLLLVMAFGSWVTVQAGHRGVLLHMGAVTGVILPEGLSTKKPWVDSVIEMEVRVQKEAVETEGASKDLQTVHTAVAANLHPLPEKVASIYQQFGLEYLARIVSPAMQESIKAVISRYTAEELITRREVVRDEIMKLLSSKLSPMGIQVDALNIVNFNFSSSFNAAIEAKVTAEQNAFAAKNKLEQIKFEAEQKVAEAKGKAEAMQVEAAAMTGNPQILQLRALEKWNGVLPTVTGGGAVPFIQIEPTKK